MDNKNCCICYNDAIENINFACNHYVCLTCFFNMINLNVSIICPMCKNPLKTQINFNNNKIVKDNNIEVIITRNLTEIHYDCILECGAISTSDPIEINNYFCNDFNFKIIKKYFNEIANIMVKDLIYNGKIRNYLIYLNDIYKDGEIIYEREITKLNRKLIIFFGLDNDNKESLFFKLKDLNKLFPQNNNETITQSNNIIN